MSGVTNLAFDPSSSGGRLVLSFDVTGAAYVIIDWGDYQQALTFLKGLNGGSYSFSGVTDPRLVYRYSHVYWDYTYDDNTGYTYFYYYYGAVRVTAYSGANEALPTDYPTSHQYMEYQVLISSSTLAPGAVNAVVVYQ